MVVVALVGISGAFAAGGGGLGCTSMFGEEALGMFDSCFLFDCQNGAIGGLIDFCSNSPVESVLFTDCPNVTPTQDGQTQSQPNTQGSTR
jgi:hypothetical protein